MLTLKDVSYVHTNGAVQFEHLNLTLLPGTRSGLIGKNGSGKSLLLQLMAGAVRATSGHVLCSLPHWHVPQQTESLFPLTVAAALGIGKKLAALQAILSGKTDETFFTDLDDDWQLEERCHEAFAHWDINNVALDQPMQTLSGGERMKVLLAGIRIHQPGIVLLDEPTNHLDLESREKLYAYIRETSDTVLVVSHDTTLLNLVSPIVELSEHGMQLFGGNYDFYCGQKQLQVTALQADIREHEKSLRKIKTKEKEVNERRQRLDARGKKKQQKSGVPKIMMNTLRNQAESSTARLRDVHATKRDETQALLHTLRQQLPEPDEMKIDLVYTQKLQTKMLIDVQAANVQYATQLLWTTPLTCRIMNKGRYHLTGKNGSGKTTALKLMLGQREPDLGAVLRVPARHVYIDQDYSLLRHELNLYDQAQAFNELMLPEHEVKIRLNRFLFAKESWVRPCGSLSGGERMRLLLCCLAIREQAPDIIVLDEPTNNLDIQNIQVLAAAIREYRGTLLVVSHDTAFVEQVSVNETLQIGT